MKLNCATCDSKIKTTVDDHHGPTIGICGHTGATFETLLSVLCAPNLQLPNTFGWYVTVYLRDGSTLSGEAHAGAKDDTLSLHDGDGSILDVHLMNVAHIQIG